VFWAVASSGLADCAGGTKGAGSWNGDLWKELAESPHGDPICESAYQAVGGLKEAESCPEQDGGESSTGERSGATLEP